MCNAAEKRDLRIALRRDRLRHLVEAPTHLLELERPAPLRAHGAISLRELLHRIGQSEQREQDAPAEPEHEQRRHRDDRDPHPEPDAIGQVRDRSRARVRMSRIADVDVDEVRERAVRVRLGRKDIASRRGGTPSGCSRSAR